MSMHNRFVTNVVAPKSVHDKKQSRAFIKDQLSLPNGHSLRTKSVPQETTLGGSFSLRADLVKGSQSGGGTFRSQKKMRQLDLLTTDDHFHSRSTISTADTIRVEAINRIKFEKSSNDKKNKGEHKSLSALLQEMSREEALSDDNRSGSRKSRDGRSRKKNRSASGVSSNGQSPGYNNGSPPGRPNSSLSTAERIRQESEVTRNCNPSDPFDNPLWNRNELSSKEVRNLQMKAPENSPEVNYSVESRVSTGSTTTRATTNYNLFSYKPTQSSVIEQCREQLGKRNEDSTWCLVRAGSRQSNLELAERCFHEVMLSTPSSGTVSARNSVVAPPLFHAGIQPRYPETIGGQAGGLCPASDERRRTLPMRPCPPPPRNEEEEKWNHSLCLKRLSMEESRLSQVSTCLSGHMSSSYGSERDYQMIGSNRERNFHVDMAAMKANLSKDLSRHGSLTDPSTSRSTNVVLNATEDFSNIQSVDNSQSLNWWNVAEKSDLPLPGNHHGHYEPWDERASAISSKSGSKCSNAYNLESADPIFGHEDLSEKDNIPLTSYSIVKSSSSTMPDADFLLKSPELEYTRAECHDPDYMRDCYGDGKDYCSGSVEKREPYVENYARVLSSSPLTSQNKEFSGSTNSQVRWDCETVFESQNSSSSHSLNQWDRLESQQSYFHDMRVPQQQVVPRVVPFEERPNNVRLSPPGFHQTASDPSMFAQIQPARTNLQNGRSSIYASFNSPKVEPNSAMAVRQHGSWSEMVQF